MIETPAPSSPSSAAGSGASPALLAAALSGLLALAVAGCGSEDITPEVTPEADAGPTTTVVSRSAKTYAELDALCDERGGFLQTHAACSGSNSCRGFSYTEPTLIEHSCRGLNWCGPGVSCVYLPPDTGRSGQEVYEKAGCASNCHGQPNASSFLLFVRPGTLSLDDAKSRLLSGSVDRLHAIVAFGVAGTNDDGTPFANMPGYRETLSRGEVERVVAHIRTLAIKATRIEVFGADTEARAGGDAGDPSR